MVLDMIGREGQKLRPAGQTGQLHVKVFHVVSKAHFLIQVSYLSGHPFQHTNTLFPFRFMIFSTRNNPCLPQ